MRISFRPSRSSTLLLTFGAISLACVLTGAFVGAASEIPLGAWLKNLAAWVAGGVVAVALAARAGSRAMSAALIAAPPGLLATFFSPPQESVHRWIDAGPLHVNMAMLLAPAAVVALAALGCSQRWPWLAAFLSLAVLVGQPDASQATAMAAAMAVIAAASCSSASAKAGLAGAASLLAAVAWFRPDELEPVAEVEGIIGLAHAVSPVLAAASVVLLAAAALTPPLFARGAAPPARLAGLALGVCLAFWMAAPALGAFPVPLIGIGMSPPVGAWLSIGLFAALLRGGGEPSR